MTTRTKVKVRMLRWHLLRSANYGHDYVESCTIIIPPEHRKNARAFIDKHFTQHYQCGHEHDCCGCIYATFVTRAVKLNRRVWNIHLTSYRNI